MRRLLLGLLWLTACGGKDNNVNGDGPKPSDGAIDSPPDAPVLPACASPVNGSTISTRSIIPTNGNPGSLGDAPLLVTAPSGDPKLYVVVRGGEIRVIENEQLRPAPFVDLSGVVQSGGELGLLGLAFHPQFHINRTFFVYYTRGQSNDATYTRRDVVARCTANANDPSTANANTCVEILAIKDFAGNHNGGMIEFGKDGYLYIGTGDGGSFNDPDGNGQALQDGAPTTRTISLLGKMLRIDVDNKATGLEYGIPADNPFAQGGGAPEIFAIGLRNPWRWSFDTLTGDIWIGDVGQDANEELDVVKAGQLSGKNFGWDMFEGNDCFAARTPNDPCDMTDKVFPVDQRTQNGDGWASIIGGQVYRGTCFPDIVGTYFYTDHFINNLVSATLNNDGTINKQDLPSTGDPFNQPTSLHAAADGELYLTTLNGGVFHIEAGP